MLGKEKDQGPKKFLFNLEMEIKDNPHQGKELLEKAEKSIQQIKNALRTGASEEEFDHLGVLLHGFTSLQKVLKKVVKQ